MTTPLRFLTTALKAAKVGEQYAQSVEVEGGAAPYTFTVVGGAFPDGVTMSSAGEVTGSSSVVATTGVVVRCTDTTGNYKDATINFTVMSYIELSRLTIEQGQFVAQFQDYLARTKAWSYGLTTTTSQTLIEMVSAVGTLTSAKLLRLKEDAFPETAQSDSAILAIAQMQGVRLSRRLPAQASVRLVSTFDQVVPPYSQFVGAGVRWFNSSQIELLAGVPKVVSLKQGEVKVVSISGLGSDLQAWVSPENAFAVSDQDVQVALNGATLYKSFGGLWNFSGQQAWADGTLPDGRLLVQFGSGGYGSVPLASDTVAIRYAVTRGADVNGVSVVGVALSSGLGLSEAVFVGVPSGGANERSAVAYKNFTAGTFGTFGSGVTKSQYKVVVSNYPGVVDAVTQAQREINPAALEWMNVVRISALTSTPWSQTQVAEYLSYVESQTMYSTRFVWQEPIPIPRDVEVRVYCLNSVSSTQAINTVVEAAITKLFSARAGILMLDLFESDIIEAVLGAAPGQISYVEVVSPVGGMVVTAPSSPALEYTIVESGGNLDPLLYAYSVSVDVPASTGNTQLDVGTPSRWVFPQVLINRSRVELSWANSAVPNALRYHVWGRRAGQIGKLATVAPPLTNWVDWGTITPRPDPLLGTVSPIRYNSLNSLKVTTVYASRQVRAAFPVREAF